MMYSYPYFRPPFFPPVYRRYSPRTLPPQEKSLPPSEVSNTHPQSKHVYYSNIEEKYTSLEHSHTKYNEKNKNNVGESNARPTGENVTVQEKKEENRYSEDNPIFEIFGIKLYFDDLLILGLLFFLYSEGVQDKELFLALILLLFS